MDKLIIKRYRDCGEIASVETASRYASKMPVEKVIERVEELKVQDNYRTYEVVDCDDSVGEAIDFVLGEGKFKGTPDIGHLLHKISELYDSIDSLDSDIRDVSSCVESIESNVKEECKKDRNTYNMFISTACGYLRSKGMDEAFISAFKDDMKESLCE